MGEHSPFNFGLVVAYLVPGFIILWGLSWHFPIVAAWLNGPQTSPTVGDLFYATLASVTAGMIANMARWAVIDTIHQHTGVAMPPWDFSRLDQRQAAYELLVELHYRYYQFGANTLVALLFTYVAYRLAPGGRVTHVGLGDLGFGAVCIVLFLGSRNAMKRYYRRAGELLAPMKGGENHGERRRQGSPRRQARGAERAQGHGWQAG